MPRRRLKLPRPNPSAPGGSPRRPLRPSPRNQAGKLQIERAVCIFFIPGRRLSSKLAGATDLRSPPFLHPCDPLLLLYLMDITFPSRTPGVVGAVLAQSSCPSPRALCVLSRKKTMAYRFASRELAGRPITARSDLGRSGPTPFFFLEVDSFLCISVLSS